MLFSCSFLFLTAPRALPPLSVFSIVSSFPQSAEKALSVEALVSVFAEAMLRSAVVFLFTVTLTIGTVSVASASNEEIVRTGAAANEVVVTSNSGKDGKMTKGRKV